MFFVDKNQQARFIVPYDFPLAVHETFLKDKPRGFNDWHWHEELQFSYVLEGEMIMTCMGSDHLLKAGDGIFIHSNCAHMTRPTGPESARYLSLNILPSVLTLFHGSVIEQKYFIPYVNDPKMQVIAFRAGLAEYDLLLREIVLLFDLIRARDFGYELETYARLLHIWKLLTVLSKSKILPSVKLEREEAHAMLEYIRGHYAESITIDDLARHVHLSRGECSRLFQATYGVSIVSHLIDVRISQSIPLLVSTRMTVAQIADCCGFNSPSYYTKVFREKVGIPPLQYRRSHAGR